MKWLDRNILYVVYGFLAAVILFQMWYIWEIKSELKLFKNKPNVENRKHK